MPCAAVRMRKRQHGCMQQWTGGADGASTTVQPVARHRVAYLGEVNADLVGSAGQEPALDNRETCRETINDVEPSVRRPATGAGDEPPLVGGVTFDRPVHVVIVESWVPLHNREVAAVDLI